LYGRGGLDAERSDRKPPTKLEERAVTDETDVYLATGRPAKVGVLMDMPAKYSGFAYKVQELVRDRYANSGRMERGIEFVRVETFGPPAGPIKNTTDGYHKLVDEGCLIVVGPNHSDSNIALTPHVEQRQVPLIALGATAQHMSKWLFSIRWASIPNDAFTCASWLRKQGCKRVCFTWDKADHSLEYVTHFRVAAERAGFKLVGDRRFPQVVTPDLNDIFEDTLAEFQRLQPDGIVHFGTSQPSGLWAAFINQKGWDVPRVMNDAFFGSNFPEQRAKMEGWCGTGLWDDDNKVLSALYEEYTTRYAGEPIPPRELMAIYRDGMTAALEGVLLAPILTPDGVRRGLESVQLLPAAIGGPRNSISFGPYDRAGLKGSDCVVLRRVKNGELVMEGRIELF